LPARARGSRDRDRAIAPSRNVAEKSRDVVAYGPALPCLLVVASLGCGTPDRFALMGHPPAPTLHVLTASGDVDENAVLAAVAQGSYASSAALVQASVAYPSAVATGSAVTEWVSADALTTYQSINPDAKGSRASLPAGTVIVRAVEDASGEVAKLTLMVKGQRGYNPDLGDWWFGETGPTGIPVDDDGGVEMGKLTGCYGCHLARSTDDFLFGVPASARTPHP
jgi:hypothetical protein